MTGKQIGAITGAVGLALIVALALLAFQVLGGQQGAYAQGTVNFDIDPETSGNSANTLGTVERCVRVDGSGGFDGSPDYTIDAVVQGDTQAPTGYDAWVTYDSTVIHVVTADALIKLPGAMDISDLLPDSDGQFRASAIYFVGAGTAGDGTILRMGLDINFDGGPIVVTFGFDLVGYGSLAGSHPTTTDTGMLAINMDCPLPEVDLSVDSVVASAPVNMDVSVNYTLDVDTTGTHTGSPLNDPVQATITHTVTAPADCWVDGAASASDSWSGVLNGGASHVLNTDFDIHCAEPSSHLFEVENEITLDEPGYMDPDAANNFDAEFEIVDVWGYSDIKISSFDVIYDRLIDSDGDTVADLAVVDVSTPTDVILRKEVHNNGPHGSTEVMLTKTAAVVDLGWGSAYAEVTPLADSEQAILPVGVPVIIDETFQIHCHDANVGMPAMFQFHNDVTVKDVHIDDYDPGNNSADAMLTVFCVPRFTPTFSVTIDQNNATQNPPVANICITGVPCKTLTSVAIPAALPKQPLARIETIDPAALNIQPSSAVTNACKVGKVDFSVVVHIQGLTPGCVQPVAGTAELADAAMPAEGYDWTGLALFPDWYDVGGGNFGLAYTLWAGQLDALDAFVQLNYPGAVLWARYNGVAVALGMPINLLVWNLGVSGWLTIGVSGNPDLDLDGLWDAVDPDDDGDTVPDIIDNCPLTANPAQIDTDLDGVGDVCDPDPIVPSPMHPQDYFCSPYSSDTLLLGESMQNPNIVPVCPIEYLRSCDDYGTHIAVAQLTRVDTFETTTLLDTVTCSVSSADKAVLDIEFDDGGDLPHEGTPLPEEPGTGLPQLETQESENKVVSVTSVEYNSGPGEPADSLVTFSADVPAGCEGRFIPFVNDTLTEHGEDVPQDSGKVTGDGNPATFEADLHFQTANYKLVEPVEQEVRITRFFELHCFAAGRYVFNICNEIQPKAPTQDEVPGNNKDCEDLVVNARPAGEPIADKAVLDIEFDDGRNPPHEGTPLPENPTSGNQQYEIQESENKLVSVTSKEHNFGPKGSEDFSYLLDSQVSFEADVPAGCEGRFVPHEKDTLTSKGVEIPRFDEFGYPNPEFTQKQPGDGNPATFESDLHFQTAEYGYPELVSITTSLTRHFELHCFVAGTYVFTFCNEITPKSPFTDPKPENNRLCETLEVNARAAGVAIADKAVLDIVFDDGGGLPHESTPLPEEPGTGRQQYEIQESENKLVSVTSKDHNFGPKGPEEFPLDSKVTFSADIPYGCEGRFVPRVHDTLTEYGIDVPQTSGKVAGDDDPLSFESDLHFQSGSYGFEETISVTTSFTRHFELHCFEAGTYVFTFCNEIQPKPPYTDPKPENNLLCEELVVNVRPAGVAIANKTVIGIVFDDSSGGSPHEGEDLPRVPGSDLPQFEIQESENLPISVTSREHNFGPKGPEDGFPLDALIEFFADVPAGCDGRWEPHEKDTLTTGGNPWLQQSGTPIPPEDDAYEEKQPGDGDHNTFESDLHFLASDYYIEEPVSFTVDVTRVFEIHCSVEGIYIFRICNKVTLDPFYAEDPKPTDDLLCRRLVVNVRAAGEPIADKAVLDIIYDDARTPTELPLSPGTEVQQFEVQESENVRLGVTSVEHNYGPKRSTDEQVEFFADIPLGCEGRWIPQSGDVLTKGGDPLLQDKGTTIPPGDDEYTEKQDGDGSALTYESDLHFQTADYYDIAEERGFTTPITREFELHCFVPGVYTFRFCNKIHPKDAFDPKPTNNLRCERLNVNVRPAGELLADKAVLDVVFDDANEYPNEGKALGKKPGTDLQQFHMEASQNVPISVTSVEHNYGPKGEENAPPAEHLDAQVEFFADIPLGCEGRWMPDVSDVLTKGGNPLLHDKGTTIFYEDPEYWLKQLGDGHHNTWESDLHFQTADYGIREYEGDTNRITRFFELHCFVPGVYIFRFCNRIEPKAPFEDPKLENNLLCKRLEVNAFPAGAQQADKAVVDITFDDDDPFFRLPLPNDPRTGLPRLDVFKSQNVSIGVTSEEDNFGPEEPLDAQIEFFADIPLGCEGRWIPDDPALEILTKGGNPWRQTKGTTIPQSDPEFTQKQPGDGNPLTFESDKHFQTLDWNIAEPVSNLVSIRQRFELHCFEDGVKVFRFCNKAEPKDPFEDPKPLNNWKCEQLLVNSIPNADKAVLGITFGITPPPTPDAYVKNSMPDLGQHSENWCWVASAANSFYWYAKFGPDGVPGNGDEFPELLDDPAVEGLDELYWDTDLVTPGDQMDPESIDPSSDYYDDATGYRRLLKEIAIDAEKVFSEAATRSEELEAYVKFIDDQDLTGRLQVHSIIDPLDLGGGGCAPSEDPQVQVPGVFTELDEPTLDDYARELSRSQDVLLVWCEEDPATGESVGICHKVTGVSYDLTVAPKKIDVSDPWTHVNTADHDDPDPGAAQDHNNKATHAETPPPYDDYFVVSEDPLRVYIPYLGTNNLAPGESGPCNDGEDNDEDTYIDDADSDCIRRVYELIFISPPPETDVLKSQNVPITVTSWDHNFGPQVPADSEVSFFADIPPGCEGRWVAEQAPNLVWDIRTILGDPTVPSDGIPVPRTDPKEPDFDAFPPFFDSDLHFQTLDWNIAEPVGQLIPISRSFELHCFEDGRKVFNFCNRIDAKDLADPNPANNLACRTLAINSIPSADSRVIDISYDYLDNDRDTTDPDLDILTSSDITIGIESVEHNNGPQDANSEITFLADIPLGCEGQWANETDTMRPYTPGNPMEQSVGVGSTPEMDPGDGILGTAESVTEQVILEPVSQPMVMVEAFELHCSEDGEFTFTFCNKQEVLPPTVDPDLANNWLCFDLVVNSADCAAGVDSDGDTFDDDVECYLPTDPVDACPDIVGVDDAWPLDNNMDTFVTVVPDILAYRGRMNTTGGPPADPMWMQRLDLNADNYITVVPDILYYRGMVNTGC